MRGGRAETVRGGSMWRAVLQAQLLPNALVVHLNDEEWLEDPRYHVRREVGRERRRRLPEQHSGTAHSSNQLLTSRMPAALSVRVAHGSGDGAILQRYHLVRRNPARVGE